MRYLFLAYGDEQRWSAMPAGERAALENACRINDEMLRQNGHLLATAALQSGRNTTTVRVQNGAVCLTNGPVAETPEQLIELFYIDARDLNEAIRVASTMPQAHTGPIEVRLMITPPAQSNRK